VEAYELLLLGGRASACRGGAAHVVQAGRQPDLGAEAPRRDGQPRGRCRCRKPRRQVHLLQSHALDVGRVVLEAADARARGRRPLERRPAGHHCHLRRLDGVRGRVLRLDDIDRRQLHGLLSSSTPCCLRLFWALRRLIDIFINLESSVPEAVSLDGGSGGRMVRRHCGRMGTGAGARGWGTSDGCAVRRAANIRERAQGRGVRWRAGHARAGRGMWIAG
jgi:hypothetical protein